MRLNPRPCGTGVRTHGVCQRHADTSVCVSIRVHAEQAFEHKHPTTVQGWKSQSASMRNRRSNSLHPMPVRARSLNPRPCGTGVRTQRHMGGGHSQGLNPRPCGTGVRTPLLYHIDFSLRHLLFSNGNGDATSPSHTERENSRHLPRISLQLQSISSFPIWKAAALPFRDWENQSSGASPARSSLFFRREGNGRSADAQRPKAGPGEPAMVQPHIACPTGRKDPAGSAIQGHRSPARTT